MVSEGAEELNGRHVTAEELQGRLTIIGLCSSSVPTSSEGDCILSGAPFHQRMRTEVDSILQASLSKRRDKFEGKVNSLLKGSGGSTARGDDSTATNGSCSLASACVLESQSSQTNLSGQVSEPNRLADAHEKAITHAMLCARPAQKKFVERKCRQNPFAEPPEKEEPIEKESSVLKNTLEALRQNTAKRAGQIEQLKSQLAACREHVASEEEKGSTIHETLLSLKENHAHVPQMHADWVSQRSKKKEELHSDVEQAKSEAKRYQALAKQQHAFLLQTEAIFLRTGREQIHRFPAGDVFLMPQPLPMDDEDKVEEYDIGTAVANPYVVDSFPFEPNVLARRSSQECPMEELPEETFEDLVEARRPVSRAPPILNFSNHDSDNDDDDGVGPSATSRSL